MKKGANKKHNNKPKTRKDDSTSKGKDKYSFPKKSESKPRSKPKRKRGAPLPSFDDKVRLNKLIANAGFCSRREADTMIETGIVTVNGEVITELGYKVKPSDVVKFDGVTVKREDKKYVLVNKPEKYSIKAHADLSKKTVFQLLKNAFKVDLIPVGQFNKDYCGLILYTNDLDLDTKLRNPKVRVSQIFHLVLDKDMTEEDLEKLTSGLFVDGKMFNAQEASFINRKPRNEVGVKILSPKTSMIKYMIGKLGYTIIKLDRVEYAGLTKLDLPRGHYRELTEKEVAFLKMMS